MRTPYGRRTKLGFYLTRPLAERGYQVLIQSVRGTFGSGGTFDPMRQEREDGLATVNWLIEQPWCGEAVVLFGLSYVGYVQWAIADQLPPQVKAMIPHVTESALMLEFLRTGGFSLESPFEWSALIDTQERRLASLREPLQARKTARAMRVLPLGQADVAAIGRHSQFIEDLLANDQNAPRWDGFDQRHRVPNVSIPVSSIGGWYDIFLPGQLRDFRILQDQGKRVRLTIGPWTHQDISNVAIDEALEFGLAYARGEQPPHRLPVRLFVMGEEAWRDFESWPPTGYSPQRFYLGADGVLAGDSPTASDPDRFRYDPADPTPSVGGARMTKDRGRVDNTALEARADVLTFTTPVLDRDVEVIGEVSAEIWFQSSLSYADVFVRLCDVDPKGRSWNICDGLTSLTNADQVGCVSVQLWATAHRFKRGHRIRVQVSSGAFPRYARNVGTGEPCTTATVLRAADQTVFHDPARPSAVILPVRAVS
ncbi:CocE/NonD family hydrolase [Nocardia pseudovaccinii]|uniref:CocE/NonD family hydrolase n=1 Tax=Nocardia pseudovaccinii TaxID=189540 RepID=UPI001C3FE570|nr:CocE/NonD family hydrolase [Nocardia pseudovaccinii]